MNIRKDILSKYSLSDKNLIEMVRLLDMAERVEERNTITYSDFLDPYINKVAEEILNRYFHFSYQSNGGYNKAERKIMIMYPNFLENSYIDIPLKVINIEGIDNCKHGDVLGSLMGLGIKRKKIGDIIVNNNLIQIIVDNSIASYIEINLTRIGKINAKPIISDIDSIIPHKEKYKEILATVQSLRLDSICAASFNESRSSVVTEIKKNKVKVNHTPIDSPSFLITEKDLISYRGKGRVVLDKIIGTTKKERIKISIKKII